MHELNNSSRKRRQGSVTVLSQPIRKSRRAAVSYSLHSTQGAEERDWNAFCESALSSKWIPAGTFVVLLLHQKANNDLEADISPHTWLVKTSLHPTVSSDDAEKIQSLVEEQSCLEGSEFSFCGVDWIVIDIATCIPDEHDTDDVDSLPRKILRIRRRNLIHIDNGDTAPCDIHTAVTGIDTTDNVVSSDSSRCESDTTSYTASSIETGSSIETVSSDTNSNAASSDTGSSDTGDSGKDTQLTDEACEELVHTRQKQWTFTARTAGERLKGILVCHICFNKSMVIFCNMDLPVSSEELSSFTKYSVLFAKMIESSL